MDRAITNLKRKRFFYLHFEWMAFSAGILAMALMNPYIENGATFCLFERIGIPFCPGHGLGHSIAFIFRGDVNSALHANIMGPFALIVLLGRIFYLLKRNYLNQSQKKEKIQWQN